MPEAPHWRWKKRRRLRDQKRQKKTGRWLKLSLSPPAPWGGHHGNESRCEHARWRIYTHWVSKQKHEGLSEADPEQNQTVRGDTLKKGTKKRKSTEEIAAKRGRSELKDRKKIDEMDIQEPNHTNSGPKRDKAKCHRRRQRPPKHRTTNNINVRRD